MTVLFSDIEGFTTISESLTPTELVLLLNEYLTEMTDIIIEHEGMIDKYVGDAITAEFGAPVYDEDHAYFACCAALHMQEKLVELSKKWEGEHRPMLPTRIGINTGRMIVGNMGSRDVFNYTVMGDHANLGARLEGANKYYGTYTMISEFTYREVKDRVIVRLLDFLRVKGKTEPVEVYELIGLSTDKISPAKKQMLQIYHEG
ncbi:MAG: adenylate/guanylate cyclase domain-containing protein, partial [Planctomycetes bacterium]|nr:adenylate/guanylate cyclase domain-containing protein [Planctomycetota bacterium]